MPYFFRLEKHYDSHAIVPLHINQSNLKTENRAYCKMSYL